ncbi:alpha/beta hydrolase [Rhodovulum marinum]|uniref:Alpha/beta hydrolase family protein DUF900 n=1 Tax=Rhodovulum marinum TaxID=320662 RepID=A0A4R2Q3S2_9RHOB|nr:alpha/beta hydrolase [Rhodovulum marinum]TCP43220.1 alpha/beta hydrolase family protein DUF900 [Rhodovulum marinum]
MPLVRVNATADRPGPLPGAPPLGVQLDTALAELPGGTPIAVLVHGFRFSPGQPAKTPHRHILALNPETGGRRAVSWPRALGFTGTGPGEGLCIAFGWESDGTIWQAYDNAARAGTALARLVEQIATRAPGRSVDILAHSLGARVALTAMGKMPAGALNHAVLMAPAEFTPRARAALDSAAGRRGRVLNVTSRENDPFDLLLEALLAPARGGGRSLGHGLEDAPPGWLDLHIDDPDTLQALAAMGHRIAPPERRVCHWSPYLRPGMLALYRALIRGALPFENLCAGLPPARPARWSRLLAPPRRPLPLPFAGNAPS